jgi:hypothetical protein
MIIGLSGKAGSGKSTAAAYLVAYHSFHRVPFAGPLKDMLEVLGLDYDHLWGDKKEEALEILEGQTARHAMQTLGTEWGRNCIGPDFWVNVWKARALEHRRGSIIQNIVVDDVRFPNEVDTIRSMDGTIVEIFRPEKLTTLVKPHVSEELKLDFDWAVFNQGSKESFFGSMKHIIDKLLDDGA